MKLDLKRSVVLVGMMGCGKSAIGSRLAMELEMPFVDLDKQIEEDEQSTITEIFEQHGEPYFRQLEKDTVNDVLNSKLCILATGGGAFIQQETREIINKLGTSIFIRTDFEVLLERVSRKNNRPLLEKGDKATILKELMAERCPVYEQADIIVDSSESIHQIVVDKIIEELSEYCTKTTS